MAYRAAKPFGGSLSSSSLKLYSLDQSLLKGCNFDYLLVNIFEYFNVLMSCPPLRGYTVISRPIMGWSFRESAFGRYCFTGLDIASTRISIFHHFCRQAFDSESFCLNVLSNSIPAPFRFSLKSKVYSRLHFHFHPLQLVHVGEVWDNWILLVIESYARVLVSSTPQLKNF